MSLSVNILKCLALIAVWNVNKVKCDFNLTEDYTLDNYLESRAVLDVLRERDNLIDPNFLVRQGLSGINFLKAFALTALLLKPVITLPLRIYVPALEQQELIKDIPTTTDLPSNDADLVEPPSPPRSKYQPKPFLDNIECMAEKVIRLPQHNPNREMFLQINIRCKPMRPKENMMASGINFNIEVPEQMFSMEQLISMKVPPLEEFLPRTRGTTTRKTTTVKSNEISKTTEKYRPFEISSLFNTDKPVEKIVEHSEKPFYWMNNYYPSTHLNNAKNPTIDGSNKISSDSTGSTTKMPWYLSIDLKATTGKPIYWMNMFYPNGVPGLNLNSNASSTEIPETTTMRKRRRRTRSTTTTTTTTQLPEYEYYDVEDENKQKKTKKRRKTTLN